MVKEYYYIRCPECNMAVKKIHVMAEVPREPIECYSCETEIGFYIQKVFQPQINENRWIPVTERLPEKTGHYLVTSELNYYRGGCWDKNKDGTTKSIAVAYYDGTDKIGGKHYWNHSHVIAWKELPKPY